MRRIALLASVGLAVLLPVAAQAKPPTRAHARQYVHDYAAARRRFGASAVGCNLVGRRGSCHSKATDARLVKSLGVLGRMLHPPVVVGISTAAPTAFYAPTQVRSYYSSSSGGCGGVTPYPGAGQCWAIPYSIVSCESGGRNVPNLTHSGANGYYQLMSGGTGTRSQQDSAAAALWDGGKGAGNWVCKG